MSNTMKCDIVSAEDEIFSGTVSMVSATGTEGEIGIMPNHSQLITRLKPGPVYVKPENEDPQVFYVSGGILEVQPHVVTILADTASRARDIDEAAAQQAKEQAEKLLHDRTGEIEVAEAQSRLAEATAQLQALERLRKNVTR